MGSAEEPRYSPREGWPSTVAFPSPANPVLRFCTKRERRYSAPAHLPQASMPIAIQYATRRTGHPSCTVPVDVDRPPRAPGSQPTVLGRVLLRVLGVHP